FRSGTRFVLTADNHNSVNGIRCYAERSGAEVCYVPLERTLRSMSPEPLLGTKEAGPGLFAYPAQSNYSGVRHPLEWIAMAHAHGYRVLLDAAAFVPSAPLRLDRVKPDFVCLSFYKMFGYPTGIGALVARHDALADLRRPWFAGGTVDWVSTRGGGDAMRRGAEAFEDGTPHFLAAAAVIDGLDYLDRTGMTRIGMHVHVTTRLLLEGLLGLSHGDGAPLIDIHGPAGLEARGGTVAFNVLTRGGDVVPFDDVVIRAGMAGVSVRGGCFCNPGCAEAALSLDERCCVAAGSRSARSSRPRVSVCASAARWARCAPPPVSPLPAGRSTGCCA